MDLQAAEAVLRRRRPSRRVLDWTLIICWNWLLVMLLGIMLVGEHVLAAIPSFGTPNPLSPESRAWSDGLLVGGWTGLLLPLVLMLLYLRPFCQELGLAVRLHDELMEQGHLPSEQESARASGMRDLLRRPWRWPVVSGEWLSNIGASDQTFLRWLRWQVSPPSRLWIVDGVMALLALALLGLIIWATHDIRSRYEPMTDAVFRSVVLGALTGALASTAGLTWAWLSIWALAELQRRRMAEIIRKCYDISTADHTDPGAASPGAIRS